MPSGCLGILRRRASQYTIEPDEFPDEDGERKWIQEHLDQPGKILLVAEVSGTIVGNVSFASGARASMRMWCGCAGS